jgi:hypothetical protein
MSDLQRDLRDVLATRAGRRVLWDLIDSSGTTRDETGPVRDLIEANHRRGARDFGRALLHSCEAASPDGVRLMRLEASGDPIHTEMNA